MRDPDAPVERFYEESGSGSINVESRFCFAFTGPPGAADGRGGVKRRWTWRAAARYLAFQAPGWVILAVAVLLSRPYLALPGWVLWGVVAAWVVKDLALFPFVWRAYLPAERSDPMVGAQGVTAETLAPSGYVRIRGELWKATTGPGSPPIGPGEAIRVTDVHGLVVTVVPDRPAGEAKTCAES